MHEIAAHYFPDKRYPIYELTPQELLDLDRYVVSEIEKIINGKVIRKFKKYRISTIVEIVNKKRDLDNVKLMKINKQYQISKILGTVSAIVNYANPITWIKKSAVKPLTDYVTKEAAKRIIAIVGEQVDNLYSRKMFAPADDATKVENDVDAAAAEAEAAVEPEKKPKPNEGAMTMLFKKKAMPERIVPGVERTPDTRTFFIPKIADIEDKVTMKRRFVSPIFGRQAKDDVSIPNDRGNTGDIDKKYDAFRSKKKLTKEEAKKRYGDSYYEFQTINNADKSRLLKGEITPEYLANKKKEAIVPEAPAPTEKPAEQVSIDAFFTAVKKQDANDRPYAGGDVLEDFSMEHAKGDLGNERFGPIQEEEEEHVLFPNGAPEQGAPPLLPSPPSRRRSSRSSPARRPPRKRKRPARTSSPISTTTACRRSRCSASPRRKGRDRRLDREEHRHDQPDPDRLRHRRIGRRPYQGTVRHAL
ncbi:MAG: hypothetical protein MZU97_13595 [Bacillus subtilis]|nr:hypothetical protein [Bacillus subtilis]